LKSRKPTISKDSHNRFLIAGNRSRWHIDCDIPRQDDIRREPERKVQKGIAMAFTIYSVSGASILLAAVIYVIVRRMWQD
jgi:hypothetical protein